MVLVHFSSKKKEKGARKNLSKLSRTKQMSRQVTTVKQVSFDSLFLYIYSNIHICYTNKCFLSCLYIKHMSWHKYLLGFHVSLLPAFSALLFVSVANTQEYRCLLSLSNFALPFTLIKENRLIPLFSFELRRKNIDQKPFWQVLGNLIWNSQKVITAVFWIIY